MKRLSLKRKQRLCRLMKYRRRRDFLKRRIGLQAKQKREKYGEICCIPAPLCFSLPTRKSSPLVQFIEKLECAAQSGIYGRIEIDFTSTEKMVSDGTLYFLANLETLRRRFSHLSFGMRSPSDAIVMQVLQQVGIARLLGRQKKFDKSSFNASVKDWHVASGKKVNAADAANIFNSFDGKITPELQRSVYTGITEAMTNCHHHAYDGLNLPEDEQKWWLFSREVEKQGVRELQVVFCDLGIGIPASLYRQSEQVDKGWWHRLADWFRQNNASDHQPNDALKIRAAIEIGATRTKMTHRGKGLKQMVGILDQLGNNKSRVDIFSGSGLYRRINKKGEPIELTLPLTNDKTQSIRGTLIHWSIPLSE